MSPTIQSDEGKAEIDDAPAKIAPFKEGAAQARAQIDVHKAAVADAAKATAVVKEKVDQLNAEHQKRLQQAGLDQPTATASKKELN